MLTELKSPVFTKMDFQSTVNESPKKMFYNGLKTYQKNVSYSLEDIESTDVTVTTGSFSMKAHKAVLQSVFPFLKLTFTHPMQESTTNVVKVKEMKEEILKSLLMFAYSNVLIIDNNNVQEILVAADYFLMPKLKLFCEEFITEQIEPNNTFGVRQFGQRYDSNNLVNKADKTIASNFIESTSGEEFLSLQKNEMVSLISRSDLKVKLEEHVFEACRRWVEHSSDSRSESMFELLQQVRLALVKPDYLANVIANFPACKSNTNCQRLIRKAALYHSNPSESNKFVMTLAR